MTFPTHRLQFPKGCLLLTQGGWQEVERAFLCPPTSYPPSDLADRGAEKVCVEMKAHTDPFFPSVCAHTHVCRCTQLCVHTCVQVYTHVCKCTQLCVHAHVCRCSWLSVRMCAFYLCWNVHVLVQYINQAQVNAFILIVIGHVFILVSRHLMFR